MRERERERESIGAAERFQRVSREQLHDVRRGGAAAAFGTRNRALGILVRGGNAERT